MLKERFLANTPPEELQRYFLPNLGSHLYLNMIHFMGLGILRGHKQVVIHAGFPGSGKSTGQIITESIINNELGIAIGDGMARVNFDHHRDLYRAANPTPPLLRGSSRELEKISLHIKPAMRDSIRDPDNWVVSSELPLMTQLKIGRRYEGVDVGSSAFYQLVDRGMYLREFKKDQKKELKSLPEHDIHFILFIAGSHLRDAVAKYRYYIKNATSLEEVQMISSQFLFAKVPESKEDALNIQRGSARLRTMDHLKELLANLVTSQPDVSMVSVLDPSHRFGYLRLKNWKPTTRLENRVMNIPINRLHEPTGFDYLEDVRREVVVANYLRVWLNGNPDIKKGYTYVVFNDPEPQELYTALAS